MIAMTETREGYLPNFASAAELAAEDESEAQYLAAYVAICPTCDAECEFIDRRQDTPHFFERRCPVCHMQRGWVPWPKNKAKRRDLKGAHKVIADATYCVICLRTPADLPAKRQRLEPHHIWPVALGGTNEASNIMAVCPDCHVMIEQRRRELAPSGRQP